MRAGLRDTEPCLRHFTASTNSGGWPTIQIADEIEGGNYGIARECHEREQSGRTRRNSKGLFDGQPSGRGRSVSADRSAVSTTLDDRRRERRARGASNREPAARPDRRAAGSDGLACLPPFSRSIFLSWRTFLRRPRSSLAASLLYLSEWWLPGKLSLQRASMQSQ